MAEIHPDVHKVMEKFIQQYWGKVYPASILSIDGREYRFYERGLLSIIFPNKLRPHILIRDEYVAAYDYIAQTRKSAKDGIVPFILTGQPGIGKRSFLPHLTSSRTHFFPDRKDDILGLRSHSAHLWTAADGPSMGSQYLHHIQSWFNSIPFGEQKQFYAPIL
jgi:hypothetical protein